MELTRLGGHLTTYTGGVRDAEDKRAVPAGVSAAAQREPPAEARTRDPLKSRGLVRLGDRLGTAEVFEFVSAHQARYPIATMCRVLEVSTSGYCAWRQRGPSARAQADAKLRARIEAIHIESRGTYGRPRVHAELRAKGVRVGGKRVARLMRLEGVEGISRRRRVRTTRRNREARPVPDLVERNFTADRPDRRWVAVGRLEKDGH